MLASVKGDAEAVKRLLDRWNKNHDINETDPVGWISFFFLSSQSVDLCTASG